MYVMSNVASRSGLRLISISTLLVGLTACGGGSSSGSSGCGTCSGALPTAPVVITQANAPKVAGAGIETVFTGLSVPMGAQTSASSSVPTPVSSAQKIARLGQTIAQQIISQGTAPTTVTGAVTTFNCAISGTTSTDAAADGTSATTTYSNCSYFAGETINGTLSMSNVALNQTTMIMSYDLVYNLTITTTSPANTATVKGDMHAVVDLNTFAAAISGTSLTMNNTNAAMGNFSMQSYSITFDANGITAMNFTFASTAIGGTAVFAMTTIFSSTTGNFPSSGAATITGANSTKLMLTILGDENAPVGSQIRLELSTDNGATYATPTYETWANLISAI